MTCEIDGASPSARLFRLGRAPDPWSWNDWSHAHSDGTFGNRWDDPESEYRVLYASTQRLGCFMETIGRFAKDPEVQAGLERIELEAGETDHAVGPGRLVVNDWLPPRRIGTAAVEGHFAVVGSSVSLAYLHDEVAHLLSDFGLDELDAGALRLVQRELTQAISRIVFECSAEGRRQFDGIRYLSRYGDEFENWGVFEPALVDSGQPREIAEETPTLSRQRDAWVWSCSRPLPSC
ncbi:MAG: RES domain-containing protein [Actinobacteria bacterium]|nr:RES domain-containing protein [Actinomycetota bacterium]